MLFYEMVAKIKTAGRCDVLSLAATIFSKELRHSLYAMEQVKLLTK